MIVLESEIEPPWPDSQDWADLAQSALDALSHYAPELCNSRLSASLLFTSDAEVHQLNREWRDKDKPTNVLSFPMLTREELLELSAGGPPMLLGDIALAYETCAREAQEKSRTIEAHAAHLIMHGLLHLAGHDHELGPAEAKVMEDLEIKGLAHMGIADPYDDGMERNGESE